MKFALATGNDKLKDVKLVFGTPIDSNLLVTPEIEENNIFYLGGIRYLGGSIDFVSDMPAILAYTFDKVWFINAVNNIIKEFKFENKIKLLDERDDIAIMYVKEV